MSVIISLCQENKDVSWFSSSALIVSNCSSLMGQDKLIFYFDILIDLSTNIKYEHNVISMVRVDFALR